MIAASPSTASPTRPSTPRLLVGVTALVWLLFASEFPVSLQGLGIAVLLAMIALDVVLGSLTGWLAFLPSSGLDERQATLRDGAYRIGFRLVGSGVLLMVLLGIAGIAVTFAVQGPLLQVPADGLTVRAVIAVLQLLVMSPTLVLAWSMPHDETAESGDLRLLPFLAVPAVALLWVAAIVAGPVQTATSSQTLGSMATSDGTCSNFGAVSRLAAGFGGSARLYAEVCWNGQYAYAVGDPSLPRPASMQLEEWAVLNRMPGLTRCAPLSSDTDFGNVETSCTGYVDGMGTLHLSLSGRIRPLPGDLAARDVHVQLLVARNGKVLTFG